jgi:hypothetical protein
MPKMKHATIIDSNKPARHARVPGQKSAPAGRQALLYA